MRNRLFLGAATAVASLSLGIVPAGAASGTSAAFQCNTTVSGTTINNNVEVPANGVCVLNGVTVNGNVTAGAGSYFEGNGAKISGGVTGNQALTLYVWNNSSVGANVAGYQSSQVFVYDSAVGQSVGAASSVAPGYGHFQVCGTTVGNSVAATGVGPDVLVGAPAAGCGANTVKGDGIFVTGNTLDQELYVIGNSLPRGSVRVTNNTGVGDKRVNANNLPKGNLLCSGNDNPFNGSSNVAASSVSGDQCSAVTVVNP